MDGAATAAPATLGPTPVISSLDHAPSPSAGRSEAGPASSKGRILVVDDDRLVLATVTHGLSQAGYEVIDADNGDDAILLAREHRPELALLDIRMEGKSGFDVAAYLREYLHIPFMFLSAFADEQTVQQVRELGAVAYLVKPLDIGQILPTVAAAFANLPQRHVASPAASVSPAVPTTFAAAAAPPSSAAPASAAQPVAAATPERLDLVAVAIGILMHRYSLQRGEAQARLSRLAADEQRPLADQAGRLVEAVELLARGQG